MAQRRLQVILDLDTGRYTGRMTDAAARTRAFGGVVDRSSGSVRQFGSSFDNLNNKMATPLSKLRDYVLILGNIRLAILNVRDIAVGWVGSLVQQSAQVERLTVLMRGLSDATTEAGRNQEAANNLRMLFAEARRTGFAVDALADSFVKMEAGGVANTSAALSSLSNAVAHFGGTSDIMHRASIAIQQMSGKGVISMEELRQQLGEAVPTAMADMARAAGMSVKEFTDLVSKGVVQAGPALELMFREFEVRYAGAGERMAATLTGQMANLKTTMMEVATNFTGFDATAGKGASGSLYEEVRLGIEKLNVALRSGAGQQFVRDIGQIVAAVARGLSSTIEFIVRFRSEFGVAFKAILAGFLAVKTANFFGWILANLVALRANSLSSFGQMGAAVRSFGLQASAASGLAGAKFAEAARGAQGLADSYARLTRVQEARAQRTGQEMLQAQQKIGTLANEAASLRSLSGTYAQNIQMLTAQRAEQVKQLNTARTLHQANIATGRATTNSLKAVSDASANLNATTRALNANRRLLNTTNVQLAATERAGAVAVTQATAAVSRHAVATTASTMAQRLATTAAAAGAVAMRALSVAVNLALGPLGMVAIALMSAASAAGWFENKADSATAAAARLRQGLADLAAMREIGDRMEQNTTERDRIKRELESGYTLSEGADGSVAVRIGAAERAHMTRRLATLERTIASDTTLMNRGADAIVRERANAAAEGSLADRNARLTRDRARLETYQRQNPNDTAGYNRLSDGLRAARVRQDQAMVGELETRRARALAEGNTLVANGIQVVIDRYREGANMSGEFGVASQELRDNLTGVAKGSGDAADAASRQATEYENARDRFENMIAQQRGNIAQLEAAATGAEGALAEFLAQKEAGMYADATAEELANLAAGFARIDDLNSQIDWGRGLRQLRREVAQTTSDANAMWQALQADSTGRAFEQYNRTEQVRARFADKIEQAAGNPERLAEINAEIETLIANLNRIDAATATDNWREMTEEIRISLMDEDEARQANFEREVERQTRLLDLIRNNANASAEERQMAEQRFQNWKRAAEERLARENESRVVTMARDWAKLGQNIQTSLGGALDSFVNGMFEADFNFGKFAASIIKDILKIIIRAMVAYAILSAIGATPQDAGGNPMSLGSFLKGQITEGFNIKGSPIMAQVGHIGGIIGRLNQSRMVDASVFANARRYHTGTNSIGGRALRPGEVPMIGMEGEAVLTEQHQADIRRRLANASGVGDVTVNVINNSGVELSAEQGDPIFNGKEMIVNVIVEAAQKEGPLRDMFAGRGRS